MIDGLKLTMPGDVLKARVARRIRQHESAVERYREDMKMDPKDQTDDHPWLPDHMLESMIDERLDRIAALHEGDHPDPFGGGAASVGANRVVTCLGVTGTVALPLIHSLADAAVHIGRSLPYATR